MYKRKSVVPFFSLLLIPLILCTVVNYGFTSVFGGYLLCGIYLFSIIAVLSVPGQASRRTADTHSLISLVFFSGIYLLISFYASNSKMLFEIVFFSVIAIYSILVVYRIDNTKLVKLVVVLALVCLAISSILSVIVLIQHPGASRILASDSFEMYGASELRSRGLAGFGLIYSFVFLVPALFYMLEKHDKKKKLEFLSILILVVTILVNILLSGYTTAFLLAILGVLLFFLYKTNKITRVFLFLFVVILFVLNEEFVSDLLYNIANGMESEAMSDHLVELGDLLAGESSAAELDRMLLIGQSWNAFLDAPLFGVYVHGSNALLGEHSTFFDILGATGLIGFLPYVLFLFSFYYLVKKHFTYTYTKKLWKVETLVFFTLQILNPVLANYEIVFVYMCVVPSMLSYIESMEAQK